MSRLSDGLQKLCNDTGASNTALARRAEIDRPTFIHFLSGKRRPTQENLDRMLLALQATPAQRKQIQKLYMEEAVSPTLRAQRECVAGLFRRVFDINERHINARPPESIWDRTPEPERGCEAQILHSRSELERALNRLLRHYCSEPTGPLMLPAQLQGEWLSYIAEVLADAKGSGEIWHLSTFLRTGAGSDGSAHNLAALADAVPFAYLSNMKYEARFAYVVDDEPLPGELMAGYLIFPDALLVIEREGNSGEIRRTPEVVASAQRIFREDYLGANDYIRIDPYSVNSAEGRVDANSTMDRLGHKTWNMRREPEVIPALDKQAMDEAIIVPQDKTPELYEMMLRRVKEISNLPLSCYFSLQGAREFLETGMCYEVPSALYRPLSPQRRIEVMERIIDRIETDQCEDRLLDDRLLLPPRGFYLTAVEGHSVNFYQEPPGMGGTVGRTCTLTETSLCEAILEFLTNMQQTGYSLGKEETLERLRRLLSSYDAAIQ